MKSAIIEKQYQLSFNEVYQKLRDAIVSSEFLLLHEIDTQSIVSKHNVVIKPLRQLLFFHPKYIKIIVENDALAINEIPIKLVIREIDNSKVSVSCPNPTINLSDYNLDKKMAEELLQNINRIFDSVS